MTTNNRDLYMTKSVLASLWSTYNPFALENHEGLLLVGKGSDSLWYSNMMESGPNYLNFLKENSIYVQQFKHYLRRNRSERKIIIWSQYHPDRKNKNKDPYVTSLLEDPFEELILLQLEDRSFKKKPDIEYFVKDSKGRIKLGNLKVIDDPLENMADQNIARLQEDWTALENSLREVRYLH